ncbi:TAXI family TRAP transporter solute-binding subunit [Thalassospira sp.]|uniref:TAXI family TRAP transporter solute-binding subunit n=1 Tax=Thalassospira sp. TaxID=1912094 RepID=UPI002734BC28|nr:TAXI family TRAP transporter solute-binding subunit [Thalassospira sp.]MDP2700187.1 TAXI family TRAP transporter solute-binding subunit [Thalassospira sp.]
MLKNILKRHAKTVGAVTALAATLALAPAAQAQDRSDWPTSVKVGTASQGGTYFVYGAGWASLVQEMLGVPTSSEVTGGPVANMALIQSGELDMGMVTMGPAYDGWVGQSELAPGVPMHNVRATFPMYPTPFHSVTLESSGITDVAGLDGKRVNVGPRTGTAAAYWARFFETLGISADLQYGGAADAAGQLQDGLIDGFAFAAGIPIAAFSQVEAQNGANIFGFNDEQMIEILAAYPSVTEFTIPAGTYSSIDSDIKTVSMANFGVAHKDLSADFVYNVMKVVLDNNDRMLQIHATAVDTVAENWNQNGFMWFHPGAIRYYKEKGIDIPLNLLPPEYED